MVPDDAAPDAAPPDEVAHVFDDLMGRLGHPMAVVTTVVDGERAGCLVGFHAQCSIEPPAYAVWISKANHTFLVAERARTFAVHFLGADDLELARLFGEQTGDDIDKFDRCAWEPGPDGVPVLTSVEDRFVGRRLAFVEDACDHACVMLGPLDAHVGEGRLLAFADVADMTAGHEAGERQPDPAD